MGRFFALRAALVSVVLLAAFLFVRCLGTLGTTRVSTISPEYVRLVGATASQGKSALPSPLDGERNIVKQFKEAFYDRGPNDKGLGIQLAFSLARVMSGYLIAVAVAVPIGFLIGMSPIMSRALGPFIQILKPISPLAWMPTILTRMRIAIGIAWLMIVAADMPASASSLCVATRGPPSALSSCRIADATCRSLNEGGNVDDT